MKKSSSGPNPESHYATTMFSLSKTFLIRESGIAMCAGPPFRQGAGPGQLPPENFGRVAGMDDRDRFQCRKPVVRCLRIANSRFLNNQPGTNQFESRPRVSPPVPCGELDGRDTDIVSQPARQIAHHPRLHVDSSAVSQHDFMVAFPNAHAECSRPASASPRGGHCPFMSVDCAAMRPIRNAKRYGSPTNFAVTRH